jgi:hypothetical protein
MSLSIFIYLSYFVTQIYKYTVFNYFIVYIIYITSYSDKEYLNLNWTNNSSSRGSSFKLPATYRLLLIIIITILIYVTSILGLSTLNNNKNIILSLIIMNFLISIYFLYTTYNYKTTTDLGIFFLLSVSSIINCILYSLYYYNINKNKEYKNDVFKYILYGSNGLLIFLFLPKVYVLYTPIKVFLNIQ